MARVLIDLYSLERQATVRHLIPYGSELEPLFRRGPGEVEGWRKLVDALERVLNEVVEIKARQWWTSDDARFRAGERVRVLPHPNFPAEATGTVAASLPPRRVRPGVLYRVKFDEPQVNANVGSPQPEADILEEYLQPLSSGIT
jgi:hypothetical protein